MSTKDILQLWLDLETTGTDPALDAIIEVAAVLTDADLNELSTFRALVRPTRSAWDRLHGNEVVRTMHTTSGLIADLGADAPSNAELPTASSVESAMLEWLDSAGVGTGRLELAGSGTGHLDRPFLDEVMPRVAAKLVFWSFDVGSLRRSHLRWAGRPLTHAFNRRAHRAVADINAHLAEARAFRDLFGALRPGRAPVPTQQPAFADTVEMALSFCQFDQVGDVDAMSSIASVADQNDITRGLVALVNVLVRQQAAQQESTVTEVFDGVREAVQLARG